ncbi:hypothetical protein MWH25_12590 [Natroniella acetigena]|uniref:hypothetical protein n=1 Tax=Natroniella acetigena TaxID=52004 RepID=UPI00200A4EB7|nr:hypothetical protein [Natroniella acetigena]MCK8828562.1 hypothetical protein [Natroniella acetigena]
MMYRKVYYALFNITNKKVESEIRRVNYDVEKLLAIVDERDFSFQNEYAKSIRNATKPW